MSWMIRSLLKLTAGASVRTLQRAIASPIRAQESTLRNLLWTARNTLYGLKYDFKDLLQSRDLFQAFRQQVPLTEYADLVPWIDQMKAGGENVLWPGLINDYAISSGTSAALNKEIPVSGALFKQFGVFAKQLVLSQLIEQGSIAPIRGKQVTFTSTVIRDQKRSDVRIGQVSGLVSERANRSWLQRMISRPLPASITQADTLDEKMDWYIDYSMDQDVRMIAMIPWLVLRFFDRLLERYALIKKQRVTTVSEIWPNLRMIICGGQPLSQFRKSIQSRYGSPQLQIIEMYGASESMFALQTSSTDDRLFLHPDNRVFYEFVPQKEFRSKSPARLTVAELQADTPYVLYITNCSGLWSYCMDDVVSFSSLEPFTMNVIGRASELLRTHGISVSGVELRSAIKKVAARLEVQPMSFHVSPAADDAGFRLQWLIEIDGKNPPVELLAQLLDEELGAINFEYRKIRSESGPIVVPLELGAFDAWVKVAAGAAYAQAKVPVLSNDPSFSNEILKLNSISVGS